jgi:Holliday junction resolvase RusA-like endonuclease
MEIHITIQGQPYVKKSKMRYRKDKNTGHEKAYTTRAYTQWHKRALTQLFEQGFNVMFKKQVKLGAALTPIFDEPVNLTCRFFMRDNARVDLSALYEGIQDVLVEVGILFDDDWHIVASHDRSGVEVDEANPRMEITITPKSEEWER